MKIFDFGRSFDNIMLEKTIHNLNNINLTHASNLN